MLVDERIADLKTLISRDELGRFVEQLNAISPVPLILVDNDYTVIYENGSLELTDERKIDPEEKSVYRFPIEIDNSQIGELIGSRTPGIQDEEILETFRYVCGLLSDRLVHESRVDSLTSEMLNAYQELNLLYELSELLSSTLDTGAICSIVLNQAAGITDSKSSVIMLLNPDKGELVVTAAEGDAKNLEGKRISLKGSLYETVVQDSRPLVIEDVEKYPHLKDKLDLANVTHGTPLICVPISIKGQVAGLISMSIKLSGGSFTSEDTKLLTAMASQAGMSLGNARLYEDLNSAFLSTVEALAAAVEAKDPYTHGHCRRVAEYSVNIAQEMGLPANEIADLRLAGILHDVGKIGISESILRRAGRLHREEMIEIRSHPAKGAEIIEHIEGMNDIAIWIRHHHERYDGAGYPDGLSGESIPLHSRILAVADAYDAMTSNRSYSPRYPYDIPIVKMKMGSGSHFDPEIIEVFLNLARENAYRKYLEEYEEFGESSAQKLSRVSFYRIDNEIINILTREATDGFISESERKKLQDLRKMVFR